MQVKIINKNGFEFYNIDWKPYSTLAFRSFRPDENNIGRFYRAGVKIMCILCSGMTCTMNVPYSHFGESWVGDKRYDFSTINNQIELFIKNAPDAYFNIMLMLDTRRWYLEQNPDACDTYWTLEKMVDNSKWREDAADYMREAVRHIEKKYGERVFAYTLMCGNSCEWYTSVGCFNDHNESDVLENKYAERAFKDPVNNKTEIEYWQLYNKQITDLILFFTSRLQQIIKHKKLVGVFSGYIMKPNLEQMTRGILEYEKVWHSPDIDMIYAPAEYGEPRSFEGSSAFLNTVDSLKLNDKLYYHELDHRTHLAKAMVDGVYIESLERAKLRNEDESLAVLRREFAMCQTKTAALWWFDFFGGYYNSDTMMKAIADMVEIDARIKEYEMHSCSEIAVFYDTHSLYYIAQDCGLGNEILMGNRDALNRIGAPYDIYNLSDIPHVNIKQYKLVILVNAYKISLDIADYINNVLKNSNISILWMYAPGIIGENGIDYNNISKNTGISTKKTGYNDRGWPEFCVEDKRTVSLSDNRIAYRKTGEYTSFYSTMPALTTRQYQDIARVAGVHIYNYDKTALYANNRLIGIHKPDGGRITISLPDRMSSVVAEDLFDGGEIICRSGILEADAGNGMMKLYLLKPYE